MAYETTASRNKNPFLPSFLPEFLRGSFVHLSGYSRCYAAFVLRNCGRKQVRILGGKRVVFVPGYARDVGARRQRRRDYGEPAFLNALKQLWALSDGLCGKRLVAFIREVLPHLAQQGALKIAQERVHERLLTVSAATVDRLLATTKRQMQLKGRHTTRPGTLLKYHIPIRTFADWNEQQPGFCEVDLVAHDGGSAFGDYCHTLDLTDVATGWTETDAVKNKARSHVFASLQQIRTRLPFPLLGIDSDNGSEFINAHLQRYCQDEHITFTRSRPYRKNDNCYVEQKNYSVVRRSVAYYRYDTPKQQALLNELYRRLRLYTNFFQPVMKIKEKLRRGSRVTRRYDAPQTPYRRLLAHPQVAQELKDALTCTYNRLNVIVLKRELNHLQMLLFRSALQAGPPPQPPGSLPPPEHPLRGRRYGRGALPTQPKIWPLANADVGEITVDFHQNNHNTANQLIRNSTNDE